MVLELLTQLDIDMQSGCLYAQSPSELGSLVTNELKSNNSFEMEDTSVVLESVRNFGVTLTIQLG